MHGVDLFQRPAVEPPGDHHVDEVKDFHPPKMIEELGAGGRNAARQGLSFLRFPLSDIFLGGEELVNAASS